MRIREYREEDKAELEKIHAEAGYEFAWPTENILTIQVVADVEDKPIAIVCAKSVPEVILAMRKKDHPLVKLQALSLIHEAMRQELNAQGYDEATCSLPPEIDRTYGRHLRKIFGWHLAWKTYTIFRKREK